MSVRLDAVRDANLQAVRRHRTVTEDRTTRKLREPTPLHGCNHVGQRTDGPAPSAALWLPERPNARTAQEIKT